jgi:hypothetical protein
MGSIDRGHRDFRGVDGAAKGTDRRAKSRESAILAARRFAGAGLTAIEHFQ